MNAPAQREQRQTTNTKMATVVGTHIAAKNGAIESLLPTR
jgi:hypothetical protein